MSATNIDTLLQRAESLLSNVKTSIKTNPPRDPPIERSEVLSGSSAPPSGFKSTLLRSGPTESVDATQMEWLLRGLPEAYDDEPTYDDETIKRLIEEGGSAPNQLNFPSVYSANQRAMGQISKAKYLRIDLTKLLTYSAKFGVRKENSYLVITPPSGCAPLDNSVSSVTIPLPELEDPNSELGKLLRQTKKDSIKNFFVGTAELNHSIAFPLNINDRHLQEWLHGGEDGCLKIELYSHILPPKPNYHMQNVPAGHIPHQPTSRGGAISNTAAKQQQVGVTPGVADRFGFVLLPMGGLLSIDTLTAVVSCEMQVDISTRSIVTNRMESIGSRPLSSAAALSTANKTATKAQTLATARKPVVHNGPTLGTISLSLALVEDIPKDGSTTDIDIDDTVAQKKQQHGSNVPQTPILVTKNGNLLDNRLKPQPKYVMLQNAPINSRAAFHPTSGKEETKPTAKLTLPLQRGDGSAPLPPDAADKVHSALNYLPSEVNKDQNHLDGEEGLLGLVVFDLIDLKLPLEVHVAVTNNHAYSDGKWSQMTPKVVINYKYTTGRRDTISASIPLSKHQEEDDYASNDILPITFASAKIYDEMQLHSFVGPVFEVWVHYSAAPGTVTGYTDDGSPLPSASGDKDAADEKRKFVGLAKFSKEDRLGDRAMLPIIDIAGAVCRGYLSVSMHVASQPAQLEKLTAMLHNDLHGFAVDRHHTRVNNQRAAFAAPIPVPVLAPTVSYISTKKPSNAAAPKSLEGATGSTISDGTNTAAVESKGVPQPVDAMKRDGGFVGTENNNNNQLNTEDSLRLSSEAPSMMRDADDYPVPEQQSPVPADISSTGAPPGRSATELNASQVSVDDSIGDLCDMLNNYDSPSRSVPQQPVVDSYDQDDEDDDKDEEEEEEQTRSLMMMDISEDAIPRAVAPSISSATAMSSAKLTDRHRAMKPPEPVSQSPHPKGKAFFAAHSPVQRQQPPHQEEGMRDGESLWTVDPMRANREARSVSVKRANRQAVGAPDATAVHLLDITVEGVCEFISVDEAVYNQEAIMGCYVCYSLPGLCNAANRELNNKLHGMLPVNPIKPSSEIVRTCAASTTAVEATAVDEHSIWWDGECAVLNGSNRHKFYSNSSIGGGGGGADAVLSSLGLSQASSGAPPVGAAALTFDLVVADINGNMPGSQSKVIPFASASLDLERLREFFSGVSEHDLQGSVVFHLPVVPTRLQRRSPPDNTFLTVRLSHRLEPVLLRRSGPALDEMLNKSPVVNERNSDDEEEDDEDTLQLKNYFAEARMAMLGASGAANSGRDQVDSIFRRSYEWPSIMAAEQKKEEVCVCVTFKELTHVSKKFIESKPVGTTFFFSISPLTNPDTLRGPAGNGPSDGPFVRDVHFQEECDVLLSSQRDIATDIEWGDESLLVSLKYRPQVLQHGAAAASVASSSSSSPQKKETLIGEEADAALAAATAQGSDLGLDPAFQSKAVRDRMALKGSFLSVSLYARPPLFVPPAHIEYHSLHLIHGSRAAAAAADALGTGNSEKMLALTAPPPEHYADTPHRAAVPASTRITDCHLGCAVIDLSTLSLGMPVINGWYNVVDEVRDHIGQVKLSVQVVDDEKLSSSKCAAASTGGGVYSGDDDNSSPVRHSTDKNNAGAAPNVLDMSLASTIPPRKTTGVHKSLITDFDSSTFEADMDASLLGTRVFELRDALKASLQALERDTQRLLHGEGPGLLDDRAKAQSQQQDEKSVDLGGSESDKVYGEDSSTIMHPIEAANSSHIAKRENDENDDDVEYYTDDYETLDDEEAANMEPGYSPDRPSKLGYNDIVSKLPIRTGSYTGSGVPSDVEKDDDKRGNKVAEEEEEEEVYLGKGYSLATDTLAQLRFAAFNGIPPGSSFVPSASNAPANVTAADYNRENRPILCGSDDEDGEGEDVEVDRSESDVSAGRSNLYGYEDADTAKSNSAASSSFSSYTYNSESFEPTAAEAADIAAAISAANVVAEDVAPLDSSYATASVEPSAASFYAATHTTAGSAPASSSATFPGDDEAIEEEPSRLVTNVHGDVSMLTMDNMDTMTDNAPTGADAIRSAVQNDDEEEEEEEGGSDYYESGRAVDAAVVELASTPDMSVVNSSDDSHHHHHDHDTEQGMQSSAELSLVSQRSASLQQASVSFACDNEETVAVDAATAFQSHRIAHDKGEDGPPVHRSQEYDVSEEGGNNGDNSISNSNSNNNSSGSNSLLSVDTPQTLKIRHVVDSQLERLGIMGSSEILAAEARANAKAQNNNRQRSPASIAVAADNAGAHKNNGTSFQNPLTSPAFLRSLQQLSSGATASAVTAAQPGHRKQFMDKETERVSNIMLGVMKRIPAADKATSSASSLKPSSRKNVY